MALLHVNLLALTQHHVSKHAGREGENRELFGFTMFWPHATITGPKLTISPTT